MNKEEFENEFIRKSQITTEEYKEEFVTLPCHCGESDCKGWAAVGNSPLSIKSHNDLYMEVRSNG